MTWPKYLRGTIRPALKRIALIMTSRIIPQNRLLPALHGLRGMAASAVVLYHLVHIADIAAPYSLSFIATVFGLAVPFFFVLSAFSLMYSTERRMGRAMRVSEYLIKRLFRIAPLFYFVLVTTLIWSFIKNGYLLYSWEAILLNVSFTFGLAPWAGIVWGGWAIGVEMLFYASLPVIMLTVRSLRGAFYLALISIVIAVAARSALQDHFEHLTSVYGYNWARFSFLPNLPFFAFGILAFRISECIDEFNPVMRWGIPLVSIAAVLGALGLTYCGIQTDPIIWGIGFGLLVIWQSKWPGFWAANRVWEFLGERSYSIYLLHPMLIVAMKPGLDIVYGYWGLQIGSFSFFASAFVLFIPLLILSEMTYRAIELPGILGGKRIVHMRWNRA